MKTLLKRIALLFALTMLCPASQQDAPQLASLPVGSATVADLKGEVTFHSAKGESLLPQRGLALTAESTIDTGKGSVLLDLQDGSQVLVKPHSSVVLKSPDAGVGSYLELFLGKLIATIQKRLQEAPPFRMGTPSAVITVRGTRFEVEVTKKKRTYIQVFEGVVEVQGLMTGGRPVMIRPGFSTEVDLDHDPQQPRNLMQEMREFDDRRGNSPENETEPRGRETQGQQERTTERENDGHPDQ